MICELPDAETWRRFCALGNTVALFWHDAYAEWQVVADPRRVLIEDCRWQGWAESPREAIKKCLATAAADRDGAVLSAKWREINGLAIV